MASDENSPLVSIVLPVYDSARYLDDSVGSLLRQTYKNLEIICVNDGSTDDSLEVLRSFADRDSRVRVVDKPNSGAADTRNVGMDHVTGEYLCFVDSDDFLEPYAIERLVGTAQREKTDVVLFDIDVYDNATGEFLDHVAIFRDHVPARRKFTMPDIDNAYKYILGFTVNKLYRSSFLLGLGLRFPRIGAHEDMPFTYIALSAARSIYYLDDVLYHYRRGREGSLSDTTNRRYEFMADALLCFKDGLQERGLWQSCERNFVNYALHMCIWKYGVLERLDHLEFRDTCRAKLFDEFEISGRPASYFYEAEDYKFVTDAENLSLTRRLIAAAWRKFKR